MAESKIPGPLSEKASTGPVPDGTLIVAPSPLRGPVTALSAAGTARTSTADAKDPAIEALDLAEPARSAAYALKKAHPSVVFTSGRRALADQARAMAANVAANRKWVSQTYMPSETSRKLQKWIDEHKDKKSAGEIEQGLAGVLKGLTDAQLGLLSKHLAGLAFDVQPVQQDAESIKRTLRGLPKLNRFLDKEGGLERWHAQF